MCQNSFQVSLLSPPLLNIFRRKFDYESEDYPKFSDVVRKYNLDVELEASGFTKQMAIDLNKVWYETNCYFGSGL